MLKKMFIRALSVGLALCMILSLTAMAAPGQLNKGGGWKAAGQSNNGNGHGYGNAAKYMIDRQIMRGDGNQNYYLSGRITRGDLMILLVRAFNLFSDGEEDDFGDVSPAEYFYSAVRTARRLGIAKGDGKNFMPRNYVTIEQVILFIERAAGYAGIELDVDLESLYDEDALSAYATREDVCELLYYALTGSTDGFDGEFGSSHGWGTQVRTIAYSIGEDETADFDSDDFSEALENVMADETLSYVKFTSLPSSSGGVLYYDYDGDDDSNIKVAKGIPYDVGELDSITFVPASGFHGKVTVTYSAYTEDDDSYHGKVVITVVDAETYKAGTIAYTTGKGEALPLDGSDFSAECEDALGETFSYLKFTSLPSSTYGILYYDYDEDDDTHTKVTTSASYTESKLSRITFVPKSTYSGAVSVSYTGYTTDGTSYTGTVKITVKSSTAADTITYTTGKGDAVTLDGSDFAEACEDALDEAFSYLKFTTLPSPAKGVLDYDSNGDGIYETETAADTAYEEDELSRMVFVPQTGYVGTVTFSYTGRGEDGTRYTGTVTISVG